MQTQQIVFLTICSILMHITSCSSWPDSPLSGSLNAKPWSGIGVNYGMLGSNLPTPKDTAKLIETTYIDNIKLYSSDPEVLQAFSHTGIGVVVGVEDEEIPILGGSQRAAQVWVKERITPFYSATRITVIVVGNEILTSKNPALAAMLIPAMVNLHKAIALRGLDKSIKVSTPNSMAILAASYPPSIATFEPNILPTIHFLLDFLSRTGSSLMVNIYPFFAHKQDPTGVPLDYALFRDNPGFTDNNSGLHYDNLFDAQVDSVYHALNAAGYGQLPVVVSETGWPSAGDADEPGAGLQNAQDYNGNLVKRLMTKAGTPYRPTASVPTYIFALFNENMKPGPTSERNFGLFHADKSIVYDVGLLRSGSSHNPSTSPVSSGNPRTTPNPPSSTDQTGSTPIWCIADPSASDVLLQESLDFACGEGGADCTAIQPGQACYYPNTLSAHTSYAINSYYQRHGRNYWNCYFNGIGILTPTDPSHGSCIFPSQ